MRYQQPLDTPPVDELNQPDIAAAVREYRELEARYRDARADADAKQAIVDEAREQDTAAYADAIRGGGKDPGQKNETAATRAANVAERLATATERARDAARSDLAAVIVDHGPAAVSELDALVDELRNQIDSTLEQLEALQGSYARAIGQKLWITGASEGRYRYSPGAVAGQVRALLGPNREPQPWPVVAAALREHFAKPKPPQAPPPSTPLLPTPTSLSGFRP